MPLPAAVAEQVSALAEALAEAQAPSAAPAAAPAASPAAALEPPPSSDYEAFLREHTPANEALVDAYNRGKPGARYRLKLFYVGLEAHARAQPPAAVAAPEAGGAPAAAPASATASDDGTSVSSASTFTPSSAASSDDGSDRAAAPQAGLVPAPPEDRRAQVRESAVRVLRLLPTPSLTPTPSLPPPPPPAR